MKAIQVETWQILVDDEDYPKLAGYKWAVTKGKSKTQTRYAVCREGAMHILIMGRKAGLVIDHVNRNGLDNRRINLRWATYSQNSVNRIHFTSSGFRGVHRDSRGRFRACIRGTHLGAYETAPEAAAVYNWAATEVYGGFAILNADEQGNVITPVAPAQKNAAKVRRIQGYEDAGMPLAEVYARHHPTAMPAPKRLRPRTKEMRNLTLRGKTWWYRKLKNGHETLQCLDTEELWLAQAKRKGIERAEINAEIARLKAARW